MENLNINHEIYYSIPNRKTPFNVILIQELYDYIKNNNFIDYNYTSDIFKFPTKDLINIYKSMGEYKDQYNDTNIVCLNNNMGILLPNIILARNNYCYITFNIYYDKKLYSFNDINIFIKSKVSQYIFDGKYDIIDWWYINSVGDITYKRVYDIQKNIIMHDEAYPYITIGINNFIKDFLASDESVLLLLGPPGTGKSKFIKYLIQNIANSINSTESRLNNTIESKCMYTTSPEIMSSDAMFMEFITNGTNLLILEDIDLNLQARTKDNPFMQKLLSLSDGIVELSGKKIIISTNLINMKDIDEALLRPGRCYGVIKTRLLTLEEAKILANKLHIILPEKYDSEKYSLAEIYNNKNNIEIKKLGL